MKKLHKDAYNFLKSNHTAVVATSYLNLPHAAAVHYTADDKFNFYFVTKMNTEKYLNLLLNKNVSIVVGVGPKYVTVQARGHATMVKGKNQRQRILDEIEAILKKKKIKVWPMRQMTSLKSRKKGLDQEVVYKMIPQHLVFVNIDDKSYPNSVSNKHHRILPVLKPRKDFKK